MIKQTKNKLNLIVFGIISVLIIGSLSYSFSGNRNVANVGLFNNSENIRIGVLLCLTGVCSEWGENSLDGIILATEEINANGGVLGKTMEIVVQDSSENDLANSVSAYQNLLSRGIKYIIGPTWTAAGLAIAPVASKDDILIMSPSLGVADFNETADNIFNIWPHDELATRALARFTFDQGWETAAIFSSKSIWYNIQGNAFKDEFLKIGGEIAIIEETPVERMDVKVEAIKIKNSDPEVVVYSNFETMGIMARELHVLGYRGPQVTILIDESRLEQAQGAFEGAFYVRYEEPKEEFINKYYKKYNKEPGITADTAYDALYLFAKAIEESRSMGIKDVKKTLLGFKEYSGASGDFEFDGLGGVKKDPVFWQVKNSEFVKYK